MLYLEVPEGNNKAEQLIGLMDADVAGAPLWPPPGLRILVCVLEGTGVEGFDDSAVIITDADLCQHFNYHGDARYKTWLWIPMGRVLEQHPMLDISQASPQTKVKVRA